MVQLTYEEMNCIRGGLGLPVIIDITVLPDPIPSNPYDMPALPAGDKRKPRPGSGGISA